jgi:serine/threonine protein kinase/Tol biopolymer transport system component
MIGKSISHYQITGKLGEGGMGEVYRATDQKLSREVALKLLPQEFSGDPQRMARFAREAQLLASLNHPNIASIHGIEDSDGNKALVLELVEGEELAERIARGPLPLDEALHYALQVCEALESAHGQGVIHRDLKPSNIKITGDGRVKVLDFGLAKAFQGDTEKPSDATRSPTLSMTATQAGIILGTAAYMAPEQARGEPVDKRADVWAFGVVLFEMLTGSRIFTGKTVSDTLAGVLRSEPEWDQLPDETPATIRRLLRRCLRREPKDRLHDIGDARIVIQDYLADPGAETTSPAQQPGSRPLMLRLAAVAFAGVAVGALLVWLLRPTTFNTIVEPVKVEMSLSGSLLFNTNTGPASVISPDGTMLAYATGTSDMETRHLHLRHLDRLEGVELAGTVGAYNPFFAPDGEWVGFVTPQELKKVSASGGTPLTLCNVQLSRGASWGETGVIVFAPTPNSGLMKVSAAGGASEPVTTLEDGEESHRWPQFLPGGRRVLFTSYNSSDRNEGVIEVVDVETGERKVVHRGGTYARYTASGHLLYTNRGTLFAAPFDLDRLEMEALPAPVLQELTDNQEGGAQYDVSDNGTLIYLTGKAEDEVQRELVWADPATNRTSPATEIARGYSEPVFSPDGRSVAVSIRTGGNADIWVHDLERDTQTRLTFDDEPEEFPVWSRDGRWVAYHSTKDGNAIFRKPADGSGEAERLTQDTTDPYVSSFSPDGAYMAYHDVVADTGADIYTLSLDGTRESKVFLKTQFNEGDAVFSPDGRWMIYESDESGRPEIYVRPFPGPGGKWQVSRDGGTSSRWSTDGRRIFYRSGDDIKSVAVETTEHVVRVGRPETLFRAPVAQYQVYFDIAPGTNRIMFVQNEQVAGGKDHLKLTFNWFEELRRLLKQER